MPVVSGCQIFRGGLRICVCRSVRYCAACPLIIFKTRIVKWDYYEAILNDACS